MKKIVKKLLIVLISILSLTAITSCNGDDIDDIDEIIDPEEQIYMEIYDGKAKEKYPELTGAQRYMASYGYIQNDIQGYNGWYYLYGANHQELTFNEGKFIHENDYMQDGIIHIESDDVLTRRFISRHTGTALISTTFRVNKEILNSQDVNLKIYKNGLKVYPASDGVVLKQNDLDGLYLQFSLSLNEGDYLDFEVLGKNEVFLNPIVDYTNTSLDTLYYLPEWGYYGDLHAYYYNGITNLFHLRSLPGGNWEWYLYETKDMFRYEEAAVYTNSFVENHYMAYTRFGDLNDYATYPGGSRDATVFYDADIDRYRWIALAYKTQAGNVDCDLAMRVSSDSYGLIWDTPAIALRKFPLTSDGEPECAAFRKIGDRWYLYAGVSGQTIHGVGPLSYWVGEPNATIDEMDWVNLPTHKLDGEDLQVPQIENINGKWYLFGWSSLTYNSNHWGGYRNLPREVFQRENGLLGTRLDPYAYRLLNKGMIANINDSNMEVSMGEAHLEQESVIMTGTNNLVKLNQTFDSTLITYTLDMQDSTEAGIQFASNNQRYRAIIRKEGSKTFLVIQSLDDPSHVNNSIVELEDIDTNIFTIKLIVEGPMMEFYVNDLIALTGRTSMGLQYVPSLYSNRGAIFSNFKVNRLAQLYDVYE